MSQDRTPSSIGPEVGRSSISTGTDHTSSGASVQLRASARGLDFAAGEAHFAPVQRQQRQRAPGPGAAPQGPAQAGPAAADTPAPGQGELGLTRGTQVDPALRSHFMTEYRAGLQLVDAAAYDGAIAAFSRVYALPNLPANARFKATYMLAFAHMSAGRTAECLSFMREAQALPGVRADFRGLGDMVVQAAHERAREQAQRPTRVEGGNLRSALRAAFDQAVAAYTGGQYQAAHDAFMRIFTDPRARTRYPNTRAAAILDAGMCLHRLGRPADGVRLVQDGLSISGISNATRLGGMSMMRTLMLATSGRAEGSGGATTRAGSRQLFDDAVAAFTGGQHARALRLFMEIYSGTFWSQMRPADRGAMVFNIAVCHQRLGHKDEALTWYQNALDRHGFGDRQTVVDAIRRLRLADAQGAMQAAPAGAPMNPPVAAPTAAQSASAEEGAGGAPLAHDGLDADSGAEGEAEQAGASGAARAGGPGPLALDPGDFETSPA